MKRWGKSWWFAPPLYHGWHVTSKTHERTHWQIWEWDPTEQEGGKEGRVVCNLLSSSMRTGRHVSTATPTCQSQPITNTDTNPKETHWDTYPCWDWEELFQLSLNIMEISSYTNASIKSRCQSRWRLHTDGWQLGSQLTSHQNLATWTGDINYSVNKSLQGLCQESGHYVSCQPMLSQSLSQTPDWSPVAFLWSQSHWAKSRNWILPVAHV